MSLKQNTTTTTQSHSASLPLPYKLKPCVQQTPLLCVVCVINLVVVHKEHNYG